MKKNKTNSPKAWLLACRPKTLTGAAAPIIVALAMAWADGASFVQLRVWLPALLCLLFAFLMQICANLVNDYFDCKRGIDGADRLGPKRACAQGWITLPAMRRGIAVSVVLSLCVGLPTSYWGGWQLLVIGALCVLFAFLYTTWFSHKGLGDLLVVVFFGIVPVCATYYVLLHDLTYSVLLVSLAMGLVTDTLLMVNNYRDRDTDAKVGKRTLVVRVGARRSEHIYLGLGILAVVLCQCQWAEQRPLAALLPLLFLLPHCLVWHSIRRIRKGTELNAVLGKTALCIFLFSVLFALGCLF
ncbi:MAG: 1,4-dihydroxy-2-naphthoate octaprenyltransferase [Bacteroidales bacterium]|nr:1,4-dihydroxy-2-naphthoate octaprenyltransferase [Candidatus Physcousia equi]